MEMSLQPSHEMCKNNSVVAAVGSFSWRAELPHALSTNSRLRTEMLICICEYVETHIAQILNLLRRYVHAQVSIYRRGYCQGRWGTFVSL